MHPTSLLLVALRDLGWSGLTLPEALEYHNERPDAGVSLASERADAMSTTDSRSVCWLAWVLQRHRLQSTASKGKVHDGKILTSTGETRLNALVQAGWTLMDRWPRSTASVLERWIGRRFFFSTARSLNAHTRFGSVVSSHLGRTRSQLEHWPHLLNWTLRNLSRDQSRLLLVAGTTLHEPAMQFAKSGKVPLVELILPKMAVGDTSAISRWIAERLERAASQSYSQSYIGDSSGEIHLSPEWQSSRSVPELAKFPLQDRAAIAVADRVLAVFIRPKGMVSCLLKKRLEDPSFPSGSLLMAITTGGIRPLRNSTPERERWLDLGAVGWLVLPPPSDGLRELSRCLRRDKQAIDLADPHFFFTSGRSTVQLCASIEQLWKGSSEDWPYLAHCTRGLSGRLPQESEASYYSRLWHSGHGIFSHPLVTLSRILRERRLRGTTWLTRGNQPSVSLSAVPLRELLKRRHFQSHLGRWDWEPYGLLFNRRLIPAASPVIYGSQNEYDRLSAEDRVYFQPVDSKYDWSKECEWRVVGDLDLRSIPAEAITVFVRSRLEAIQLARESPFPIIWSEGIVE